MQNNLLNSWLIGIAMLYELLYFMGADTWYAGNMTDDLWRLGTTNYRNITLVLKTTPVIMDYLFSDYRWFNTKNKFMELQILHSIY